MVTHEYILSAGSDPQSLRRLDTQMHSPEVVRATTLPITLEDQI
jgi:hypothetical protein